MILLDTSFLYAYFEENDSNHKKALALAEGLEFADPVLHIDVLKELISVVTARSTSKQALQISSDLMRDNGPIKILYDNKRIFEVVYSYFAALGPHRLSYVDCLLVALAKEFSCKVLSFDKAILKNVGPT